MTDKTDYQDYHKYSWQVLSPPFSVGLFIKARLFYIFPSLVLFFFLSKKLAQIQKIIIPQEMHVLIFIICIITLLIIVIFDYSISKSFDRKISYFSISQKGISINQKITSLNRLQLTKLPNINHLKKKKSYYYLKIHTKSLPLSLKFTSKKEVEKFLQAINEYAN